MARVRIPDEPALKCWDDVNLNMKEIGECQMEIERIEADMNAKISDIKLEAEMEAKPHKERIKKLEIQIKEFVEMNKSELDGKSKVLNFGKTGFRKSTKIVTRGVAKIIKNLKAFGMNDCIKIKESINKEVLKKYSDEEIAKVGATKKVQDVFWYEVDKEKLKA
jgi:phage host-nuclease inhibitor protein Gam